MSKKILLLLITIVTAAYGCTPTAQVHEPYAQIRPMEFGGELILPGGEILEDTYFRQFFKGAGYVLIGENHTNMTDHLSQATILDKMAKRRLRPIVGLEMVTVDKQAILDRFNNGRLTIDQLESELDWAKSVGYSFELYRPLFEVARKNNIPVYALNIPRRVVREARLKGLDNISEQDKRYLPGKFIPASEEQREYLNDFFSRHPQSNAAASSPTTPTVSGKSWMPTAESSSSPTPTFDGFLTAQALWDSSMAWQAMQLHKKSGQPVVIIVGQGHVEYGWGIALRLRAYDETAKIVKVMPWRTPMESAFLQQNGSPLLDPELPSVFPTPDIADIYFYSPNTALGRAPQGLLTGQSPNLKEFKLMVLAVEPKSLAQKAGFLPGDIILQIDQHEVNSGDSFYGALAQGSAYGSNHSITLLRGNEKLSIMLPSW